MSSVAPHRSGRTGDYTKKFARAAALFLGHQLLSTIGVLVGAGLIVSLAFSVLRILGHPQPASSLYHLLTELPYYPIQVACAFVLGWFLARRASRRVMLWVWMLPAAVMVYSLLAFTAETPVPARVGATLPFYTSAAYSMAAALRSLLRPAAVR